MATKTSGPGVSGALKRVLVGRAISMHSQEHQLLPKFLALPVFSSDPLSSVAYATEEMMLVLVTAGAATLVYRLPIAIAIASLLAIVVTSYRQTVRAYPRGGGSYIVARENLGTVPGLVAAAAILIGYVVTAAVSVTAGAVAVSSAVPGFAQHRVTIAMLFIAIIALANLRGVRESGILFAVPTYGFVLLVALQIFTALILVVAANTAYQDFPRLSAILAGDRFMPSQFKNRGDRLVFSNGVFVLASLAVLLIWLYDASLTDLIHLYVIGVFTAFTLSQA